jgi:hypothetical protein
VPIDLTETLVQLLRSLGLLAVGGIAGFLVARMTGKLRGRRYVCSKCLRLVSLGQIHVIPFFYGELDDYVTAFRCESCWLPSLDETQRQFIAGVGAEAHRLKFVAFFDRYGIHNLSTADSAGLSSDGLKLLQRLREGRLMLPPPNIHASRRVPW